MSLTGVPLAAAALVCTVAALAGTVLLWNRWGTWRLLTRPVGVLLTEALVLVSVGLVVNRSEEFYPTWHSLFQAGYTGGTSYAAAPGGLDAWLAAQPGADGGQALAFTWRQAGWPGWGLDAPPTVVVPAGYLRHKGLRYPVIVVLDGSTVAGTPGAAEAGPAVVVFLHPAAAAKAAVLATDLAGAVSGALRVTAYRWAVVADPAWATLGAGAVAAAPTRYSALAELCTAAGSGTAAAAAAAARSAANAKRATPAAGKPAPTAKSSVASVETRTIAAAYQKSGTAAAGGKKTAATAKTPAAAGRTAKTPAAAGRTASAPAAAGGKTAPRPVSRPAVACAVRALPAGVAWTSVAAGVGGAGGLPAALAWAARELPPPLAASTPPPAYLPPARRRPHPGASGASEPPPVDALSGTPKAGTPKAGAAKAGAAKAGAAKAGAAKAGTPAALTGVSNTGSRHVAG